MRLGVIDIGSNTVHLLVVDAYYGAAPVPAHSQKIELRLARTWPLTVVSMTPRSTNWSASWAGPWSRVNLGVTGSGVRHQCHPQAVNGDEVLEHVRATTGIEYHPAQRRG